MNFFGNVIFYVNKSYFVIKNYFIPALTYISRSFSSNIKSSFNLEKNYLDHPLV